MYTHLLAVCRVFFFGALCTLCTVLVVSCPISDAWRSAKSTSPLASPCRRCRNPSTFDATPGGKGWREEFWQRARQRSVVPLVSSLSPLKGLCVLSVAADTRGERKQRAAVCVHTEKRWKAVRGFSQSALLRLAGPLYCAATSLRKKASYLAYSPSAPAHKRGVFHHHLSRATENAGLHKKGVLVYACVRALITLACAIFISSFFRSSKYRAVFFPPRRNFFPTFPHPEMRFFFRLLRFLGRARRLGSLGRRSWPVSISFFEARLSSLFSSRLAYRRGC